MSGAPTKISEAEAARWLPYFGANPLAAPKYDTRQTGEANKWVFKDHVLARPSEKNDEQKVDEIPESRPSTPVCKVQERRPLTLEEAKAIISEEEKASKERQEQIQAMMKGPFEHGVVAHGVAYFAHPLLLEALCMMRAENREKEKEKESPMIEDVD
jgi:hypothetical protein